MEDAGAMLLSWNIVGDSRWIQRTNSGIQRSSTPAAGQGVWGDGAASQNLRARRSMAMVGAACFTPAIQCISNARFFDDSIELIKRCRIVWRPDVVKIPRAAAPNFLPVAVDAQPFVAPCIPWIATIGQQGDNVTFKV